MSNLKRSNTLQTIKRAGTGAWRWINAEDADVNQTQPIGHSYFQRSNTYKKLREANASAVSSGPENPYQMRQRQQYGQGYNQGYGYDQSGYNQSGYGSSYNNDYNTSSYSLNMNNDNNGYGNDIKRPEPIAEKEGRQQEKDVKRKRNSKIPSVLYDPNVRKQLEKLKQYKPYFMYGMTGLQIFMLLVSFIVNFKYSGRIIASTTENLMLGPSAPALIHLGARYVPCMKQLNEEDEKLYNVTLCSGGLKGSIPPNGAVNADGQKITENLCSLSDLCGMGGFEPGEVPNQWYRFILPMFLHAGIIHIFVNLTFQIRTGVQMEKDFGTWRVAIIYMASGIFGFAFGANFSIGIPSVGCSGALYGLLACLLLDLIQSWKLIINPWTELFKMSFIIIFSLGTGLLPFIDNFAHVGGFITGIFSGLVFMPTITFSKWDLRRKRFMMIISIPILIGIFIWVFEQFYHMNSTCKWCKYVNCIPINGWCDDV